MKSFLPPNCLKGGMCLLHLQKATMHTAKWLLLAPPRERGCGQLMMDMPHPFTGPKNQR